MGHMGFFSQKSFIIFSLKDFCVLVFNKKDIYILHLISIKENREHVMSDLHKTKPNICLIIDEVDICIFPLNILCKGMESLPQTLLLNPLK